MMKRLLLIIGLATASYAGSHSINYPSAEQQPAHPPATQSMITSDCSHLSDQEKEFAAQLSDMHRTMFCRHFSVSQRLRAMTLVSPEIQSITGPDSKITPDEAIEAVMKDSRQNDSKSEKDKTERQEQNPYSNHSYPNNSMKSSSPYSN